MISEIEFKYVFSNGDKTIVEVYNLDQIERIGGDDIKYYAEKGYGLICRWQYTGLKDCNGVKIFENDIIIQHAEWNETSYFGNGESESDSFEFEFIGIVSITASKGVVINSVKKMDMIIGGGWVKHLYSINVRGARSKVIGNTYQNKDLLNGK